MASITDIAAYSALGTDFEPRVLARTDGNKILLDGFIDVVTLNGAGQGVFLIPFRPNQSPQSWMYVAAPEDYQKLSAPDSNNDVTVYKVGLEEPQRPPEASPKQIAAARIDPTASDWTAGGIASGLADSHCTDDTIGALVQDPVAIATTSRWSIQVTDGKLYQVSQLMYVTSPSIIAIIQDVLPPINEAVPLEIDSIYYYAGSTGHCVIVPRQLAIGTSLPSIADNAPLSDTVFAVQSIANLRRGALVELADYTGGGGEVVLVLSVIRGPRGLLAFECVTTGSFQAGDTVTGVSTIVVEHYNLSSGSTGDALYTPQLDFTLTGAGTGYVSHAITDNPFTNVLDTTRGMVAQMDDYVSFIIAISDLSKLIQGRIIWNIDDTVDYATNVFYADFTTADILRLNPSLTLGARTQPTAPTFEEFLALNNFTGSTENMGPLIIAQAVNEARRAQLQAEYNQLYGSTSAASFSSDTTLYPSYQRALIQFPIRALVRGGNNQNLTLANCNGVRIQLDVTATVSVHLEAIWVGGGGQGDVGRVGQPYFYAVRGRSSITGAVSNPSPMSRYGVSPRRQQVTVEVTDFVSDPQQDMWDVFRFGGTVTSWRYIGSMPNTGGGVDQFVDDMFDTSILLNPALEFDNFEPWPSIDLPWVMNGTAEITGTVLVVTFPTVADVPALIANWLPGTLVLVAGTAYTLWNRPTLISGTVTNITYLFRTVESMGFGTTTDVQSNEPVVGNQHLPYVFGPDANNTVFACGDPLRPGTLYYSKANNPDSAPDTFNTEVTQPSEPLLGGEILNGIAYGSSSARWFRFYPDFGSITQRYQKVDCPIGRPLAAPYGHCNDGKFIYFWANDGIWATDGSTGQSLVDGPLQNLFPHEGVDGANIEYANRTIYAPDYTYVAQFRLAFAKGYLYADYRDSNGTPRTLVLDTTRKNPAWVIDEYADPIIVHYLAKGPEDNLNTAPSTAYPKLFMGDTNGHIWVQQDFSNDGGVSIPCAISTFEYNGGDIRADQFWGDSFLDSVPASGLSVTPISDGSFAASPTSIPAATTRVRAIVHSSNITQKCMGLLVEWDEDFDYLDLTEITKLFAWQPLYQAVPLAVYTWQTQATSFGMDGYSHIREILAAYKSADDVTITITTYDGNSPTAITLPSTNGVEQKVIVPCSFNKGLLWTISGVSSKPWTPYFDAWEFHVGQWGRVDAYKTVRDIEAPKGIARSIEE